MYSNKQAVNRIKSIVESDELSAEAMVTEIQELINRTEGENEMNDEKYDYERAVRNDILEYLNDEEYGYIDQYTRDKLYDDLFVYDGVTGNGSGSYTYNTWKAESYLCHNTDLIEECAEEFGIDLTDGKHRGAEYWDVSIRCMLMGRSLDEIVEEWNEEHPEPEDADEE